MTTFADWSQRGFSTDLIPIVPPDAPLSPFAKIRAADRGKVPGRLLETGEWIGLAQWATLQVDPMQWDGTGANIGLRTKFFPAIDIDVEGDKDLALAIAGEAGRILGLSPIRHRANSTKLARLYRTNTPFRRMRVWLKRDQTRHLVEVLGDGQQLVVDGQHASGQPIAWHGRPESTALPCITAEQASQFLVAVEELARARGFETQREGSPVTTEGPRGADQAALTGDVATLTAAMASLPNTNETHPDREDYLRVGYALKAALPADPDTAFRLWWEWCQRWEGNANGQNTLATACADWDRMTPPFLAGAAWLLEHARRFGHSDAAEAFPTVPGATEAGCRGPSEAPEAPEGEAPSQNGTPGTAKYSDAWVARLLGQKIGPQVRYCPKMGGWLRWDGTRWAPDQLGWILETAGEVARASGVGADATTRRRLGSEAIRRAAAAYLATHPDIATPVEAFDSDPWALNTPAGIVDLRTGAVRPADPTRLFTRCTAVAPAAGPATRWLTFLHEATEGDTDLVDYLQRLAGYALTGSTREHVLAFFWGPGGNGKGVFLNTLVRLLGSYAGVAAMDTFTASRFDRHPADLASLFGTRLVTAQETQEGRAWDEAKVKSITGGDPVTARLMRENFFTYTPQFKLLFAGNHKPKIHNLDDAMRRRFHLVPFTVTPKVRDVDLPEHLQAEWPQILQWALEGCLAWQRDGLRPPSAVLDATREYFEQEDIIGRWLAERVETGVSAFTETRDLWADWQIWCQEKRERPGSERSFVQTLLAHGVEKARHPTTRRHGVAGIQLRPYGDKLLPISGALH